MKKLYVSLLAGLMAALPAHAADEPVVIGEVTMPAVQAAQRLSRLKKAG